MKKTKPPLKKQTAKQPQSKALVPTSSRTVGPASDLSKELAADAGAGTENFGRDDLQIPRIVILQQLSPQVVKNDPQFIKGAEAGQICDVVNARVFDGDTGILLLPFSYRRTHIEWKPRKTGGGFVADHGPDGEILKKCTKTEEGVNELPNKNVVNVVGEYFAFLIEEDGKFAPFVVSMTGSQLKKSRQWNTMINRQRLTNEGMDAPAPMFYMSYRMTTVPEKNDKGSWFGWLINADKAVTDKEFKNGVELYRSAKTFREAVVSGKAKAAPPTEASMAHPTEDPDSAM